MAEQEEAVELTVKFEPVENVKSEWVETVTRELGNELEARMPSTTSAAVVSEVPQGARAHLIPELGALAFQVRPRVLPELMGFLRNWLQARRGKVMKVVVTLGDRSMELEFNPKDMASDDTSDLIEMLTGATERSKENSKIYICDFANPATIDGVAEPCDHTHSVAPPVSRPGTTIKQGSG